MKFFSIFFPLLCILALASPVLAEVKIVEADSTYVLGDNDTRVDARRIAVQEAQRKALEQAGTYVAGLTEVKEYRLTRDEVTAYAAGIVQTETIADEVRGTRQHPEVYIKVRCKIDSDVMVREIDRYRDNEELRDELEAAAKDKYALRKERDDLRKQLAAEKDKNAVAETQKKLGSVLTREEGIDASNRAWARIEPQMDFYSGSEVNKEVRLGDLQDTAVMLEKTVRADPDNRQARVLLAAVYEQKNDRPGAEAQLRAALERTPDRPLLHMRLGIVLREQGRNDEALREFRVIEQKRPHQPQMLFQTGLTYKAMGQCRPAVGYMKRFLMFTRKVDNPAIERLKPKAKAVIESCGDLPPLRRKRRR